VCPIEEAKTELASQAKEEMTTEGPTGDAPWPGGGFEGGRRYLTKKGYCLGLAVIFISSYSQYLVSGMNLIAGTFWVYGISIAAISIVAGGPSLKRAFRDANGAFRIGLASFGAFTVAGSAASLLIVAMLKGLDPSALTVLQKPLPVLEIPHSTAWLMAGASILVVGPCEEYIFRGFVFGGLLKLFGTRHWLLLAFASSILFAGVHLYYAIVYQVAALVPFVDIVAIGMALACAYYLSKGNLLMPALIHGVYDAMGFVGVATQPEVGVRLRAAFILVCILVALKVLLQRRRGTGRHSPGTS
jgi:membrane protease YdiL (CAAX protease family)